jgi:DNA gyrase subunit A
LLQVFIDHRLQVVRRRSEFRRTKANDRLHLVDGLLVAILDIDEVIAVIRGSDDTAAARERLMSVFDLSEIQTNYILEMPLRRLTKFSRLELEKEQDELRAIIADLTDILENDKRLRKVVGQELTDVANQYGDDRRSQLLSDDGIISAALPVPLEVTDDPCFVLMSATGLLARTTGDIPLEFAKKRTSHDTIRSMVRTTARGDVGIVTSFGRVIRQSVVNLPALAEGAALSVAGGAALKEFLTLNKGETALALMALDQPESTMFLTTAFGTVKRVVNDVPASAGDWNIIRLEEGDYLVGAIQCEDESGEVVLITSDAQLLHFDASLVRATGRPAAGVVGIRLYEGAEVIFGSVVDAHDECLVATVGGEAGALPGTAAHTMKLTPLTEFPGKGRATSGVRCHKFLSGEDVLVAATAGNGPIHACGSTGAAVDVPDKQGKRDSTGTKLRKPVAAVCSAP